MPVPTGIENIEKLAELIKAGLKVIYETGARRVDLADNIKAYTITSEKGKPRIRIDIDPGEEA